MPELGSISQSMSVVAVAFAVPKIVNDPAAQRTALDTQQRAVRSRLRDLGRHVAVGIDEVVGDDDRRGAGSNGRRALQRVLRLRTGGGARARRGRGQSLRDQRSFELRGEGDDSCRRGAAVGRLSERSW
jgi:hypothetical protein